MLIAPHFINITPRVFFWLPWQLQSQSLAVIIIVKFNYAIVKLEICVCLQGKVGPIAHWN